MKLLRAILIVRLTGAADHTDITGQPLPGSRPGQQPQENRQIRHGGNHLFHSGDADVDPRGRSAEPPIALVSDDDQGTGFGYQKIGPADPQVGLQELLPQSFPGHPGHFLNIIGQRDAQLAVKQFRHLLLGFVQGRRYQMGRGFLGQLDDVFPQIRLKDLNADSFEGAVQVQFLGNHGLAFGRQFDLAGAGDFGNDSVGLGRVPGEVNITAIAGHLIGQQFQVIVQMVEGMGFDAAGFGAPLFPSLRSNFLDGLLAGPVETAAHLPQGAAQGRVLHSGPGGGDKIPGLYFSHQRTLLPALGRYGGRLPGCPGGKGRRQCASSSPYRRIPGYPRRWPADCPVCPPASPRKYADT